MQLGTITGQIQKNGNLVGEISTVQNLVGELNNSIIELTPVLEDLTVTPDVVEQNFKSDIYGYDNVKVKAIESEEITITPTNKNQVKDGLYNKIIIIGDSDLAAENIKQGVEIFGVTGTAEVRGSENCTIITDVSASFSNRLNQYVTELPMLNFGTENAFSQTFSGMSAIKTIPLIDTSNATTMSQCFSRCTSLETIPLINTSKVRTTRYMFDGCSSLISIPQIDTANSTNMEYMFNGCSKLTTVPVLDTSKVTNMSNMFTGCTKLTSASLNNIMQMCINSQVTDKRLRYLGLTTTQCNNCKNYTNYQALLDAGWVTGT